MSSDDFVERGLSYDLNGNLLSLERIFQGAVCDALAFHHVGNRLMSLSGTTSGLYRYDSNGNMTHDGPNRLDLSYNALNLTEKVLREGSIIAKYSYLSDGTKLTATDASGNGLYYLGSLVYRKQGGALSLESAAFGGGRFVATATGVEPHYFITDHLGSVRAVVNAVGEVGERNDYFPYGLRWENPMSLISDNRHRYNGKEEQSFVGLPYTDYGARMRDPRIRPNDWNGGDPLTEKTPGTSSYGFCGGNPVVRVDKDGKIWETLWDIGNLVYDVSAAIYNHVTGDHVRAKEHWSDAGMDLVATAIPVVPAGVDFQTLSA